MPRSTTVRALEARFRLSWARFRVAFLAGLAFDFLAGFRFAAFGFAFLAGLRAFLADLTFDFFLLTAMTPPNRPQSRTNTAQTYLTSCLDPVCSAVRAVFPLDLALFSHRVDGCQEGFGRSHGIHFVNNQRLA